MSSDATKLIDTARSNWLAARLTGVGASDAAAALGKSRWKSPLALQAEKMGLVEAPDLTDNEAVQIGIELEPMVASRLARATGWTLTDPGRYSIQRHPTVPYAICTVDRFVEPPAGDHKDRGVAEIKTTSAEPEDVEAGQPLDATVPMEWLIQVQHQLWVNGLSWGVIPVLHIGRRKAFRWLPIERNGRFIDEVLSPGIAAFWAAVQSRAPLPPGPDDREVLTRLYPRQTPGKSLTLTPDLIGGADPDEIARQIEAISARVKADETEKSRLQNLILAAAADAEIITTPGGVKWTYKEQKKAASYAAWYKALPDSVKRDFPLPDAGTIRVLRGGKSE